MAETTVKSFPAPSAAYVVEDQQRMTEARQYFQWQYSLVAPELGQRVLEVGCGLGNFTKLYLDRELVVAIDVEAECVRMLKSSLGGNKNLVCMELDVQDSSFEQLRKYQLDSIVCLNVLEHVKYDRLALSQMQAILPVGGRVVLIVPAFDSLYGPIDTNLGHYRRYTKASLSAVAESAGLKVIQLRYMNSLGYFGWWWNARILKKTAQSESQIAFFDSLCVPVLSRLERLIEPPVGQSVFAVLEKSK